MVLVVISFEDTGLHIPKRVSVVHSLVKKSSMVDP